MDPILWILTTVAEAFIDRGINSLSFTNLLPTWIRENLQNKRDPVRQALTLALGTTIRRYATNNLRFPLAGPLLQKNGFLTKPEVANEFAQLVCFNRAPNAQLIGQQWKAALDNPPSDINFTEESERLLEYLKLELRGRAILREVWDSQSLDEIKVQLEALAPLLEALAGSLTTDLTKLIGIFEGANARVRDQIIDNIRFIADRTYGFVGRQFVFDAVAQFINNNPRGYFFVLGEPGIGKSALAAQLVKTNGYIHHFNIRAEGINRADTFLRNVCAQLIAVHKLDHPSMPLHATQDAAFLKQLLREVSAKLGTCEKQIIIVDALDEVDTSGLAPGTNPLFLPQTLDPGIYFVITTQRVRLPRVECEQQILDIRQDSPENRADISTFIKSWTERPGIQAYIKAQGIDDELFINDLADRSEGNFMYLHYVLPEIETEGGAYKGRNLKDIPTGLKGYYEDHWVRMRGQEDEAWFNYKLPVIMALTVVKEPVPIELLADFSGVQQRSRIRSVLNEWKRFLDIKIVTYGGNLEECYRLYHSSFYAFIADKPELDDERDKAEERIIDFLLTKASGNE